MNERSEISTMAEQVKVLNKPVYEVTPMSIKENIFMKQRKRFKEELTRRLILMALDRVKRNPEKYSKPFKTMRVLRIVPNMTAKEFDEFCKKEYNARFANEIENALEKAQRITNGETWREACEHPETAGWDLIVME